MSESFFPILGPILVIGIALPASALVAKALLAVVAKLKRMPNLHESHGLRYAVLVASSAVPLAWFISASLHQAESGANASVCIAQHDPGEFCREAAYFSLALVLLTAALGLPRLLRQQFPRMMKQSTISQNTIARVHSIVSSRPGLMALRGRVLVADELPSRIATFGVVAPRVVVLARFVDSLDDESLAAALQHELEHVRGRDPLRYFIAWWALAVNPIGGWYLRQEYAQWLLSREAHCDREAVIAGASPTGLARALLAAARPSSVASTPALGDGKFEAVKIRVGLLMAYADRAPRRSSTFHAPRLILSVLGLALTMPHVAGTEPLDVLHAASERAASMLHAIP